MLLKFDVDSLLGSYERYDLNENVVKWVYLIFYTNSVLNVFVYAGKFKDFQQFIKDNIRCCEKRKDIKPSLVALAPLKHSIKKINST